MTTVGVRITSPRAPDQFSEAILALLYPRYLRLAYSMGTGVALDNLKAARWWRKAAVGGNTDAQFNLGLLYAQGEGVVRNMMEAARWWHQAATRGDAAAQYALGLMFARGDGIAQRAHQPKRLMSNRHRPLFFCVYTRLSWFSRRR